MGQFRDSYAHMAPNLENGVTRCWGKTPRRERHANLLCGGVGLGGFDNPRNVQIFLERSWRWESARRTSYTMYGLLISRVLPQVLPISIVFGIVGFFLPDFWLSSVSRSGSD